MKMELNWAQKFCVAIVRGLSHLPLRFLYIFSDILYFFLYKVARYRVKVVRENLALAYTDKYPEELRAIEKKFYRHLCDYFIEMVKNMTISEEELSKRFVYRNKYLVQNLIDQGKHVFFYAAHFANWEWFTAMGLVFPKAAAHAMFQPQNSKIANNVAYESRSHLGVTMVTSNSAVRFLARAVKEHPSSVTLILGDQCPHRGARKHWIDFMGQDTPFLVGPEYMANRLNMAMVYPSFVSYKRGHYELEFRLITENAGEMTPPECTKRFAAMLEEDLRGKYPELWLWSHRRWKHKHENFPDEK